jgi:hypothetical protein
MLHPTSSHLTFKNKWVLCFFVWFSISSALVYLGPIQIKQKIKQQSTKLTKVKLAIEKKQLKWQRIRKGPSPLTGSPISTLIQLAATHHLLIQQLKRQPQQSIQFNFIGHYASIKRLLTALYTKKIAVQFTHFSLQASRDDHHFIHFQGTLTHAKTN